MHWILEMWNIGIFAEFLVINTNTLKIHKEHVECCFLCHKYENC